MILRRPCSPEQPLVSVGGRAPRAQNTGNRLAGLNRVKNNERDSNKNNEWNAKRTMNQNAKNTTNENAKPQ